MQLTWILKDTVIVCKLYRCRNSVTNISISTEIANIPHICLCSIICLVTTCILVAGKKKKQREKQNSEFVVCDKSNRALNIIWNKYCRMLCNLINENPISVFQVVCCFLSGNNTIIWFLCKFPFRSLGWKRTLKLCE